MDVKELKDAVEEAAKGLSEATQGAVRKADNALELAKAAKELAEKGVDAEGVKKQLEGIKIKMADGNEYGFQEAVDLLQTQFDKLSAKQAHGHSNQKEERLGFDQSLQKAMEEATDSIEKFNRKEVKGFSIELKAVGDMSTANVTGGSRYGAQFAPQIIENPARKTHIRDLIPVDNVGPGNTFTFMKENGNGEGAIAPVAEGATKPQIDFDLVESTVNFETIAGWLRLTRKAMMNIPGLIAFLRTRLPEKLLRIEDTQILYGDGSTPNLKGILTSGNFTALTNTTAPLAEKIIDALSLLEDTNEEMATGILLRPAQMYNFYKQKASGSGEYDLPKNFVFDAQGNLRVNGVPVYASTAINADDFAVGAWDLGAQLLQQEAMRLEFFEQDGTNVRENKVTVRIEETVALPVYGARYFVKGQVSNPA